jgi:thiamine-monophosphate kinase
MTRRLKTVQDVGEFPLIERLKTLCGSSASVVCGIGDDCAVVQPPRGRLLLFKTDMVVEHVHFTRRSAPEQVGHKAMGRPLSDIAAMAGEARCAVVAIAMPARTSIRYVDGLYRGMHECAAMFGVDIVGGDTSRASQIMMTVSVLGNVTRARCVYRSGAKPGDGIYVTGVLGGTILRKHVSFVPRIKESQWLAHHVRPSAMIDISDGFVQDIGHILEASGVGAEIDVATIPISQDASRCAGGNANKALHSALYDGEDFELLFTVPREREKRLAQWSCAWSIPCTRVGTITEDKKLRDTKGHVIPQKGYVHFLCG